MEVEQTDGSGRIRRSARRGLAVAVLGWLGVAALSVLMAPSASAAPQETVEIMNFTPPVKSVDRGGQITFVNKIPAQNKGGISIPLVGNVTATVFTDVSVTFFGQKRDLQPDQSAAWTFNDPATRGVDHLHVPDRAAGRPGGGRRQPGGQHRRGLAAAGARCNVPYVVETLVPLPNAARRQPAAAAAGERADAEPAGRAAPARRRRTRVDRRRCRPQPAPLPASRRSRAPRAPVHVHHRRRRAADVAGQRRGRLGVRPVALLRAGQQPRWSRPRRRHARAARVGSPAATTAPRCRSSASSPAWTGPPWTTRAPQEAASSSSPAPDAPRRRPGRRHRAGRGHRGAGPHAPGLARPR